MHSMQCRHVVATLVVVICLVYSLQWWDMVVARISYLFTVYCRAVVVNSWSHIIVSMPSLQCWHLVLVDWSFVHNVLYQLQFRNVV